MNKVASQSSGKLRFPKDRALRPRRPIDGLDGYSVSQNCYIAGPNRELESPTRWPYHDLLLGDVTVELNAVIACAHAWLDEHARASILEKIDPNAKHSDQSVQALEGELQVSRHAILAVAKHPEALPKAFITKEIPPGSAERIELERCESYYTKLKEPYRPPSRGGNTRALHRHQLTISGEHYSFLARGSRKWVFASDRVSFTYTTTPEGYKNIIPETLRTFDKNGTAVIRGDRSKKPTLRTAATRTPVSRREDRD